jgi:DNA-binding winged helix-turn-helix (wHTH) protein
MIITKRNSVVLREVTRPEMKVFEPFRLDIVNLCLWRYNERMPLTRKAFDILRYLVERADRLVTHDEILEALWPETYVNPEGLRKYILEIRKVLGDRPNQPLFIETLPKRGYQFIAKVTDERIPLPSPPEICEDANLVSPNAALTRLNDYFEMALNGQRQVIFELSSAGFRVRIGDSTELGR